MIYGARHCLPTLCGIDVLSGATGWLLHRGLCLHAQGYEFDLACLACRSQAQGKEGRFFLAEPGGGAGFDPGVVGEKDGLPHSEHSL